MTLYIERSELETAGISSAEQLRKYIEYITGRAPREVCIFAGKSELLVVVV